MENTKKVRFSEDDEAKWYVAIGESWIGPLKPQEVFDKIRMRQITNAHFAWQKGQREWRRICDIKEFNTLVPERPTAEIAKEVKKSAKVVPQRRAKGGTRTKTRRMTRATPPPKPRKQKKAKREWFLYYDESQIGPFAIDEIRRYISIGKLHANDLVWKYKMKDWGTIGSIEEFEDVLGEAKKKAKVPKRPQKTQMTQEKRGGPRKPLVATVLLTDDRQVCVGVCRDLSVGGMQVLTDKIPGKVGTRVKVNVSPSETDAFRPFVAVGVIVRILDDGLGFSFRFEEINESAKQSIETYIEG